MNKKRFMIMSLVLGAAFLFTTAFASAASVWTIDTGLVKKTLTVGTNSNKGKLYVKGSIRNPVKGKMLKLNDNVNVTGNLKVGGILQGSNIVSSDNLGTGVVTETKLGTGAVTADKIGTGAVSSAKIADDAVNADKLDFSIDGVVKAAAYVPDGGTITQYFDKMSSSAITATNASTGTFVVTFGSTVSSRYIDITPRYSTPLFFTINSVSTNAVTVKFYATDGSTPADPTGFYITVY